jgi:hypothetical protein
MTSEAHLQDRDAKLSQLLAHLDKSGVLFDDFGCFVALSQDKSAIFTCPILADGSLERNPDDVRHMNWCEVTAPEPDFIDRVNGIFATGFQWQNFPGR